MLIKTTGIVLRRAKQKESDLSVQLLDEDGALIELYMHGIRASKSRSQLLAEPGTLIRCEYYQKDERGGSFREGAILDRFDELKGDYTGTLVLSYLLEMIGLAARGGPMPENYQLLNGAMEHLRGSPAGTGPARGLFHLRLLAFFKVRLLRILGLMGDCEHCEICGNPLGERAGWNVPEVSFRCRRHAEEHSREEAWMAVFLTRAAVTRFDPLLAWIGQDSPPLEVWRRMDEWLSRCLEHYFATPSTVSMQLYKQLF